MSEGAARDGTMGHREFLSGSSCHQCKTRQRTAQLVQCMQSHARKASARRRRMPEQLSSDELHHHPDPSIPLHQASRHCRKKYCARKPLTPPLSLTPTLSSPVGVPSCSPTADPPACLLCALLKAAWTGSTAKRHRQTSAFMVTPAGRVRGVEGCAAALSAGGGRGSGRMSGGAP